MGVKEMKRALVLALGVVLLAAASSFAISTSDYHIWRVAPDGSTCIWGITSTGRMDLVGGAQLDNTTASTLTITETNISLVGVVSFTGASAFYGSSQTFGYDSGAYIRFAVSDTTGVLAITHAGSAPATSWTNGTSLSFYTPSYTIGYDAGAYLKFAVTDTTGVLAITQAGSGEATTWTNDTSLAFYTPSYYVGYDADSWMKISVADTTGNVTITQTGSSKALTWTAGGGFDFVGAAALDATTVTSLTDGTATLTSGDLTGLTSLGITGDTTQTGSVTLIGAGGDLTVGDDADVTGDLDVDGITNLDVVDIDDAVNIAGALTHVGAVYRTGNTSQTGSITLLGTGGDLTVADDASIQDLTVTTTATFAGATIANLGSVTTADINGGTVDGATIGAGSAGAGTFTTMTCQTGSITYATIGGGYGATGVTVSAAGVIQANGAITTDGSLTADSAAIGGGYGSTGVSLSTAGVIQANGAITSDGAVTGGSLTDGTATVTGGNISSTAGTISLTTNSLDERFMVFGIGYNTDAQTPSVNGLEVLGGGMPLTCAGLDGGAASVGSTEGYVSIGDAADYCRFAIPLPPLWLDNGQTGSLVLQFNVHEQTNEECNMDVRLFEYGNTTAILTDTLAVPDTTARGWASLVTNSTGIGQDTDLTGDDTYLIVELTSTADTDDFYLYGVRWNYDVGVVNTQ